MPNFNAQADVYFHGGRHTPKFQPILPPKTIHTATIADSVKWIMKNHHGYPDLYSLVIPLEAGFQTTELHYRDIEVLSKRPDFPR